ncbi:MAG TPA: hypothetical protein VHM88_26195 [Candidatus Acidoferrales bacterium]|nr:hypothetical protein [Candidatus Acidoferrales bacterium]
MSRLAASLLICVALLSPAVSLAGDPPAKPRPAVARHTWTSEEVQALREKGLISLVGQQPPAMASAEPAAPNPEQTAPFVPRPVQALDPDWYGEQVEKLRAAIRADDALSNLIRRELSNARYWEAGINLNRESIGITPHSELEILTGQNRQEQEKIAALWEKARRNGIPPGALR